jgi:hypothetical protein
MSNGVPPQAFFEVTAQLMPVLLLAVLVEHRLFDVPADPIPQHASRFRQIRTALWQVALSCSLSWRSLRGKWLHWSRYLKEVPGSRDSLS